MNLGELSHVNLELLSHQAGIYLLRGTERVLVNFPSAQAPPDKHRRKTYRDLI